MTGERPVRRLWRSGEECACGHGWQLFEPGVCWHCAGGELFCWACLGDSMKEEGQRQPYITPVMGPLQLSGLCDKCEEKRREKR